jgi:hypothetical protein
MIKTIKQFLIIAILAAVPVLYLSPAVSAQSKADVCKGVDAAANAANACADGGQLNRLITNAITLLSYVVGIVAVVMIIVAGFKYITASGDSNNIASAKNTLIFAIVGLVIAASARIIIGFVASRIPT